MANLIPNSYCQLKSVNIINIENDQPIIDWLLKTVNGTEPMANILKVGAKTDGQRVVTVEPSAIQLTQGRYVWLWCSVETHTLTSITISDDLIIYPTGLFSDDILSYAQRVIQISDTLKKEFEGKAFTSELAVFESESGAGEIILTIPLLVSILMTRCYYEKDDNLVSVAKLMICNICQLAFLDWF